MIIFYSDLYGHYYSDFHSPLDQIKYIIFVCTPQLDNILFQLTNWGFYFIMSLLIILNILRINNNIINWSQHQKSIHVRMNNLAINKISSIKSEIYFLFIYSLFIFILINNFLGMVPYSFASTSHFIDLTICHFLGIFLIFASNS